MKSLILAMVLAVNVYGAAEDGPRARDFAHLRLVEGLRRDAMAVIKGLPLADRADEDLLFRTLISTERTQWEEYVFLMNSFVMPRLSRAAISSLDYAKTIILARYFGAPRAALLEFYKHIDVVARKIGRSTIHESLAEALGLGFDNNKVITAVRARQIKEEDAEFEAVLRASGFKET